MPNIVYVLTNPAMPGIVKIGMTERDDVQRRMNELYSTGVPLPFDCAIARQIEDTEAARVEAALHTAFGPYRVNPSREFFEIDSDQAEALLQVMPGQDVTPRVSKEIAELQPEDVEAASEYKRHQAKTNEEEFLASLNENGIRVYERVLALGKQEGMHIKWNKWGFSLYVVLDQRNVVICYGYPRGGDKYSQSIYTAFYWIGTRTNVPPEVIEEHRKYALDNGLFVPVGGGNDIACRTGDIDESRVPDVIGWLEAMIRSIRESAAANSEESLVKDLG